MIALTSLLVAGIILAVAYGVACLLNRFGFFGRDAS